MKNFLTGLSKAKLFILLLSLIIFILVYRKRIPGHTREERLRAELGNLKNYLAGYPDIIKMLSESSRGNELVAWSSINEIGAGDNYEEKVMAQQFLRGVGWRNSTDALDPWGAAFYYTGKKVDNNYSLTFWSIGINGVNESGFGDDIKIDFELREK